MQQFARHRTTPTPTTSLEFDRVWKLELAGARIAGAELPYSVLNANRIPHPATTLPGFAALL